MPFVDRPLPPDFEIASLRPRKSNLPPGPGPGRPAGGENVITKDLKRGIIDAAAELGSDGNGTDGLKGWLRTCAAKHPKAYLSLLSKLVPMQIADGLPGQFIGTVNIHGIPSGSHLTAEDIARFGMPAIEHEPASEPNEVA